MAAKLGRNDRCPCASGKKYKKCCLFLTDKGVRIGNALQAIRRASSHEECLAPTNWHNKCNSTIIDAHTVPERSLRTIARQGRRHPAGAGQRRAHRPPTRPRSASADRHDAARHRSGRPRRLRAPPAVRLRVGITATLARREDPHPETVASTAIDPGRYLHAQGEAPIVPMQFTAP